VVAAAAATVAVAVAVIVAGRIAHKRN